MANFLRARKSQLRIWLLGALILFYFLLSMYWLFGHAARAESRDEVQAERMAVQRLRSAPGHAPLQVGEEGGVVTITADDLREMIRMSTDNAARRAAHVDPAATAPVASPSVPTQVWTIVMLVLTTIVSIIGFFILRTLNQLDDSNRAAATSRTETAKAMADMRRDIDVGFTDIRAELKAVAKSIEVVEERTTKLEAHAG